MSREYTFEAFVISLSRNEDVSLDFSGTYLVSAGEIVGPQNFKCKSLIIVGAEFRDNLIFSGIQDMGVGIKFINCNGREIKFKRCCTNGANSGFDNDYGGGIIFENCRFDKIVIEEKSNISRGFHLRESSEVKSLFLLDSFFLDASINIENSTIEEKLEIARVKTKNDLGVEIRYSKVSGGSNLESIHSGSISLISSVFNNYFFIGACEVDSLTLNNTEFNEDVEIISTQISLFTSYRDTVKKGLIVKNVHDSFEDVVGHLSSVYIQSTFTGEGFKFYGNFKTIESISIPCTSLLTGSFSFYEFDEVSDITISGQNKNASLEFYHCTFQNIVIDNFQNHGTLLMANSGGVAPWSSFEVVSSYLNKFLLINFDFELFNSVDFYDSFISGMEVSGGDFFSKNQLFSALGSKSRKNSRLPQGLQDQIQSRDKEDRVSLFKRKGEIYRQLKLSMERHGNRILSSEFKGTELKFLQEELRLTKSRFNKDRIMMWLSSSNDMGVNWSKPLKWLIVLTVLIYPLVIWNATPQLSISDFTNFTSIDWVGSFSIYGNYLSFIPQMFNPIRNLKNIFPECNSCFWLYFWDGFHRIILAFLIFQIVSAFRKYIK